jgi:hypothetical protein
VTHLLESVSGDMLRGTFEQISAVEAVEMRSGAGVVWFQDAEIALEAQQRFDGVELCGSETCGRLGV